MLKLLPYWKTKGDLMAGLRQNAVLYCASASVAFSPLRRHFEELMLFSMEINDLHNALMDDEFEGNIREEEYAP